MVILIDSVLSSVEVWRWAARPSAAAVERMQDDVLPGGGEAFGAPTLARLADHVSHRQQRATGGDRDARSGFQVLQWRTR
jgi:hypothetical protein